MAFPPHLPGQFWEEKAMSIILEQNTIFSSDSESPDDTFLCSARFCLLILHMSGNIYRQKNNYKLTFFLFSPSLSVIHVNF